jgi:hypothetical protein
MRCDSLYVEKKTFLKLVSKLIHSLSELLWKRNKQNVFEKNGFVKTKKDLVNCFSVITPHINVYGRILIHEIVFNNFFPKFNIGNGKKTKQNNDLVF